MLTTSTLKGIAVATALSVGALTLASPAEAGRRHHGGGGAAAAAIIGLGAAAIIAGSHRRNYYDYGYSPGYYAPPPQPYYYAPSPQAYYGPTTYRSYAPAPWTPAWYRYCSHKYRSFHARSGTYQPYHGPRQLCR